jgi:hypothetical protein
VIAPPDSGSGACEAPTLRDALALALPGRSQALAAAAA